MDENTESGEEHVTVSTLSSARMSEELPQMTETLSKVDQLGTGV